jgi:hypothetical protein
MAMKKVLSIILLVVICAVGGAAYVGYRFVKNVIASGCSDCVYENNGGAVIRGSGNVTTETRTVGKFTSIDLASSGNVVINRTGADSLSVTGDDNLLSFYTSEVKDGTLYLSFAKGKSFQGKIPIYRVTVADLRDIHVRGSGDLDASNLDGDALSVIVSGSGDVRLAGRADDLTLSISGSGSVDAAELKAQRAKVGVSGSGDATVNASDTLDARVSGSGSLRYLGAPKLTSDVTGSGSIEHKRS